MPIGLYNDKEIDSANITEKQQKMDFLEKVIKVVGIQLNTLVEARPAKIVAGLDAQVSGIR
jgi:TRAF3-interacting protein 1